MKKAEMLAEEIEIYRNATRKSKMAQRSLFLGMRFV